MNNVQCKGQTQGNCVFNFVLQLDILHWVSKKAEFAGSPDEFELSLESL